MFDVALVGSCQTHYSPATMRTRNIIKATPFTRTFSNLAYTCAKQIQPNIMHTFSAVCGINSIFILVSVSLHTQHCKTETLVNLANRDQIDHQTSTFQSKATKHKRLQIIWYLLNCYKNKCFYK